MVEKLQTYGGEILPDETLGFDDVDDSEMLDLLEEFGDSLENINVAGRDLLMGVFSGMNFAEKCEDSKPLGDVIEFFGGMIDDMGLKDALFFKNENVKVDFAERFEVFSETLESEIAGLERKLKIYEYKKFSDGWQDRLRKAAYYAFFIHYGAKRKLEIDGDGNPKDYVNHVARSTFNCLIRKMQFFDEESAIVTMLHDTREDWSKSFISILHMSEKDGFTNEDLEAAVNGGVKGTELQENVRKKSSEILSYMKKMEDSLNPFEDESDIGELMKLVTKKHSDRNRTLLEFLYELSDIDYDDVKFHHKWKALMIKMADRLDNARTVVTDPEKDLSETSKQIHDETALIYMEMARKNGMVNAEDWYVDYLKKQNLFDRGVVREVDHAVEKGTGMKRRFIADFQRELVLKCPEASLGENYWIEFRPVGIRYLNSENSNLSEEDYDVYSQKLRSYMMFLPIGDSPDGLIDGAKKVFSNVFSKTVPMPNRSSDENPLEEKILKRVVDGKANCAFDERFGYGVGVWTIFDNQREAVECLLGDFHLAYFYDDKEAAGRVMDNFKRIAPEIEKLMNFYDMVVLDLFDRVKEEPRLQSLLDFCMRDFSDWVKAILRDGEK